mmetsp:Transcript_90896/g.177893  ORF Transcript_90896/g.177893 Transcript_90896/m.177893 type:complete len:747 (+) Transcript_90896:58-2298(+)
MLNNKGVLFFKILLFLGFFSFSLAADDDCPCCKSSGVDPAPDWVTYGGFLILIIAVIAMFWGLALVCEEFFVPALNILCEEWKIPDDVAGATFMAAGASSPELFTGIIGLLIYDSNIGVGTVVGSEIFNHMVISAGSILFAKNMTLELDARIVMRDLIAYVASMFVLIWCLKGTYNAPLAHMFDKSRWDQCLDVTLLSGFILLILYAGYAVVCGNFQRLTKWFCPREELEIDLCIENDLNSKEMRTMSKVAEDDPLIQAPFSARSSFREGSMYTWETQNEGLLYPTEEVIRSSIVSRHSMARKSSITGRPSEMLRKFQVPRVAQPNNEGGKLDLELQQTVSPMAGGGKAGESSGSAAAPMSDLKYEAVPTEKITSTIPLALQPNFWDRVYLALCDASPPADLAVYEKGDGVLKCYMHVFGDIIKFEGLPKWETWSLRYFTIDKYGLHSVADTHDSVTGNHVEIVDLRLATDVELVPGDSTSTQFFIKFNSHTKPAMQFRAPSPEIRDLFVAVLRTKIKEFTNMSISARDEMLDDARDILWTEFVGEDGQHVHHSLLDIPRGNYAYIWHWVVLPLKVMFHYTLYDCREPGNRDKYGTVILISVLYLALLSYIMINCCDYLGDWLGATPTVMGLTLSAVGTSFPNLWSSMLVARQGYGGMAISNALGSNIFNVNVALGLPWVLYVLIQGGSPYKEMKDEGIVFFIILLILVSIIWLGMVLACGFKMHAWMIPVFLVMYVVVLAMTIAY